MGRQECFTAARDNLFAHAAFAQSGTPGMLVRDLGAAVLVDSGLASETFNRVLWKDETPGANECLREAEAWFSGKRPRGFLAVPDHPLPPATERSFILWAGSMDEGGQGRQDAFFEREGYAVREREIVMALPLAQWVDPEMGSEGIRIVPVGSSAGLEAFAAVAGTAVPSDAAFGRFFAQTAPVFLAASAPVRLFVAFAGDTPVGSGELFLSDGGNTAGLHLISTCKAFRRRGIAGAVVAAMLREARLAGVSLAVLPASAEGRRSLYEGQGFKPCGGFTEYSVCEGILY